MTLKLTFSAVLPFAILAIATPALANDGYVPDQGWPRPHTEALLEEYFGNVLARMNEPPISTVPLPDGIVEQLRVSVLQAFDHASVITIEHFEDGRTTIRTSANGVDRTLSLSEEAGLRDVLRLHDLSRFDFRNDEREREQLRARDGCLDGYTVYFERVATQGSFFSIGRCQLRGDFRAVTQHVLQLAGLAALMEEL